MSVIGYQWDQFKLKGRLKPAPYIVMAYVVMADVVMADVIMAYVIMADIV